MIGSPVSKNKRIQKKGKPVMLLFRITVSNNTFEQAKSGHIGRHEQLNVQQFID